LDERLERSCGKQITKKPAETIKLDGVLAQSKLIVEPKKAGCLVGDP
jgi:hypothetical protein